jgi:SAM-dependent methyltransferase
MSGGAEYQNYAAWKAWDNPFNFTREDASRFAAETSDIPFAGANILEIGFGEGRFLAWAQAQGARVSGSELTPASLEAAVARGIPLTDPDFEISKRLEAGSFDLIAAFDVFEHLDQATIAAKLAAMATALKPGGVLILRYPNGQSPFGLDPQHGDATHITPLSRAKIEQLAAGTGLVTTHYGAAASGKAPDPARALVRGVRALLRLIIERVIRFAYATGGELAPVVTHRLIKPLGNSGSSR